MHLEKKIITNQYMKKEIIGCYLSLIVLASCSQQKEYKTEALVVETESVSYCNESEQQSYVGTIEEEEAVSVSFTSMGTLRRVLVSEGQSVSKGQLLAELDDTQARNMLEGAEATVRQAEDAISRYKQLYEKGSLAESKWIEAQSKLDQAHASLKAAQKNLADCQLKAPIAGIIGQKQMTAGATALPSQPVVTIYKINNVKVKVAIPEREMSAISATTPSQIHVAAADLTLPGGLIEKGVVADGLTHTYNIRIVTPNTDHKLLPGMVCNVTLGLNVDNHNKVQPFLTLPIRCIQQSADGQHFIWVVNDQLAHRQPVTLGKTIGNRIEITSELQLGTKVIVYGYQKVSEGSEVKDKLD